jgi:hypothetical protein
MSNPVSQSIIKNINVIFLFQPISVPHQNHTALIEVMMSYINKYLYLQVILLTEWISNQLK